MSDGDLSYDVKRTDSLISPYTGYILMTVKEFDADKYGDIHIGDAINGFRSFFANSLFKEKKVSFVSTSFSQYCQKTREKYSPRVF